MKVCSRCHNEKEEKEFDIDNRYGNLRSWCRECCRAYYRWHYHNVVKPTLPVKEKIICKDGFKFCVRCKTEKEVTEFYKGNICKMCANALAMNRYYTKHDEIIKKSKEYRERNKDKILARGKEARLKYDHTKYSGAKWKEYRQKMTNSYVRYLLRNKGVKNSDITQQLIDEERTFQLIRKFNKKISEVGKKRCSKCKKIFPISEFYVRQWKWRGVKKYSPDNICKSCSKERNKAYLKNEIRRSQRNFKGS